MDTIFGSLTKLLAYKIMCLIILLNIGIHSEESVDFCEIDAKHIVNPDYKLSEISILCNLSILKQMHMTVSEKESIVNTINVLRNNISKGGMTIEVLGYSKVTFPEAASVPVLQWDDELAKAARKRVLFCPPNTYIDNIKCGLNQAEAIRQEFRYRSPANLKEALEKMFFDAAKYFNKDLVMDYPLDISYGYFTTLAYHGSLFVGCGMAQSSERNYSLICFFAPSAKPTNNMLYIPGTACSKCPFSPPGFHCSPNYTSLCIRPKWNISDERWQNTTTTTTAKVTTTLTTSASTIPSSTPSSASTPTTSAIITSSIPSSASTTTTTSTISSSTPSSASTTKTASTIPSSTPSSASAPTTSAIITCILLGNYALHWPNLANASTD